MLLVVDANVLFSAMIVDGKTRELLFSDNLQLMVPEFLFTEFEGHIEEIKEKSGLSREEMDMILSIFKERMDIVPKEEFESVLKEANDVCPDPDDTEYFALSIAKEAYLWSDEKRLKKQDKVKVISTSELITIVEKKEIV